MRSLLVVEHDADTPAGLLADWAAGQGVRVATIALHAGQALPQSTGDCDAVALLGSEHTAYDDSLPWLAAEMAFTERLLAASVPVLGICFGGQVLARVLGARLYRLAEPEIGWITVDSAHPALAPGPWPSWHRDAFDLPPGSVALAENAVSLQAFASGPHAGLQFHPEATRAILAGWAAGTGSPPGAAVTGPMLGADAGATWTEAARHAGTLFSAWLDGGL